MPREWPQAASGNIVVALFADPEPTITDAAQSSPYIAQLL
jgi:hypothetical protein